MKKIINVLKRNKYSFFSFLIVSVVLLLVYGLKGITPFGSAIVSGSDNYHQYSPFLKALAEQLVGGNISTYSVNLGLGGNWIGNIYNYLTSPFNLVILLTGSENVHVAMAFIVLLKCAAAAFTLSYFLRKTNEEKQGVLTAVFGVLYGLSGYALAFCLNVMWLDGLYVFPIVIYGLWKIVHKNRRGVYVAALAYALITNYYIGYMICIATVIFYLYLYFSEFSFKDKVTFGYRTKSRFAQATLSYAVSSVFAGLISIFVLLPQFLILKTTPAISTSFSIGALIKFLINPFNVLSQLSTFYTPSVVFGDQPNIFCGTITVIFAGLYFAAKTISKRKKIATGVVISIFVLCFMVSGLNLVWHAFSAPHGFAQRFSFIFSFLLVWIAHTATNHIDSMSGKKFVLVSVGVIITIAVSFMISEDNVAMGIMYIFLAAILTAVLYIRQYKPQTKRFMTGIVVFFVLAETFLVSCAQVPKFLYKGSNDIAVEQTVSGGRSAVYDIDKTYDLPYNSSEYYGYTGIDVFSSIYAKNVSQTMYNLGAKGNRHNSVQYTPSTPYFNMLFGINNISAVKSEIGFVPSYTKITSSTENMLHTESKYPTGIGYGTKAIVPETQKSSTVIENQQNWVEAITGITDLYTEFIPTVSITSENIKISADNNVFTPEYHGSDEFEFTLLFSIEEDGEYYIDYDATDDYRLSVKISVNDAVLADYSSNDIRTKMHYLGNRKSGDVIKIITYHEGDYTPTKELLTLKVFSLKQDKVDSTYSEMKDNGILRIASINGDTIEFNGTVSTEHVFITIPYDENWHINIDGVETEYYEAGGVFIGIDVESGQHVISMTYKQKMLIESCIISAVSLVVFVITDAVWRKKRTFLS